MPDSMPARAGAARKCVARKGAALAFAFLLAMGAARGAWAAPGYGEPGKGESSRELWFPSSPWDAGAARDFRIGASGSFRILILSDIQLASDPRKEPASLEAVRDLVAREAPDLVLTTGDNSAGLFAGGGARTVTRTLDATGLPWGVVLGNHDAEGMASREETGRIYATGRNSVFRPGPSTIHGIGNYGLTVSDASGRPVFAIVMLDSNSMRTYPDGKRAYDFIYPDQVAWYEWFVKGASAAAFGTWDPAAGKVLPSILVFHIPLPEFVDAMAAWEAGAIDPALVRGERHERLSPAPVNSGLFDAVLRLGSTTEIICGHDHVTDTSMPWKGVRLTYGVKTGPGSYSRPDMQGATLVTIAESGGKYLAISESVFIGK